MQHSRDQLTTTDETEQHPSMLVLEQVLGQLGQAVILLKDDGELLFSSSAANRILNTEDGLAVSNGKLSAVFLPDNMRLKHTIQEVLNGASHMPPRPMNLHVHRGVHKRPYLLSLVKMPNLHGFEQYRGNVVMVSMRDMQANFIGLTSRMRQLFDMTPREVETAILLTEGRDCKEIAELLSLSLQTVRQHLKSSYKKMRVNKQHELVCLTLELSRKR